MARFATTRWCCPRDIEYNAILKGNDNHTQAYAYAWQDEHTLKLTHSVVNSLSVDYYTLVFDKDGVQVHIEQNAYYDNIPRKKRFTASPRVSLGFRFGNFGLHSRGFVKARAVFFNKNCALKKIGA